MAPIDETIKKIIDYCKHKPLDMNILTDLKFPNAHSFHTFIHEIFNSKNATFNIS